MALFSNLGTEVKMPIFAVSNVFNTSSQQKVKQPNRFDVIMPDRLVTCSSRFESGAKYNARYRSLFDAENITSKHGIVVRFASEGRGLCKSSTIFDAVALFEHPCNAVSGKFDLNRSWDTRTSGRFNAIRPSYQQVINRFDAVMYLKYAATSGLFDAKQQMFGKLSNIFDIMPGYQRVLTLGRFDSNGGVLSALPIHKQALVKPGWRILLRNVETNVQRDLGFIEFDALEKAISDVDIPDGDYEITLLYSSLFWQNAVDRVVRNVTIRSGETPSLGLPPILNLRSEIENGITRILWDSETGFEDVTFGLWFAESPPVVVMREPDQTVEYTASGLEYRVNSTQSLPIWCVVMATKGSMRGPASEIFLPWSNDRPRRPDDQMAFHVFLDEKLQQLKNATGQSGVENIGWNPKDGFW